MRNSQLAIILVAAAALIGGGVAALTMTARFRFQHPRNPNATFIERGGRLVLETTNEQVDAKPPPKAVVEETSYDFGVLSPHSSVSHKFKIRNEGEGPLRLKKGKTSCKCTFAGVPNGWIRPGGEAEIELTWNTGSVSAYRQTAEIKTNDPDNPRFRLTVLGKVDVRTALDPEVLELDRLEPDRKSLAEFLAYSRDWDEFDVRELTCTIPGAVVEATPADAESLQSHDAKSGWRVVVSLPEMAPGRFSGAVRGVMVSPEEGATEQPIDLYVSGKVLRRLSVYGARIDALGNVTLGVAELGEVKSSGKLYMKVKDEVVDLPIKKIDVKPDYLTVRVEPASTSKIKGLYALTIETKRDAPVSSHLGDRHGVVRFEFDHPRISELKLNVRFAVISPDRS